MNSGLEQRIVGLDEISPARSRHTGRRSAVALTDEVIITGTATGSVLAHDRTTLDERWRAGAEITGAIVSVEPFGDGVVVGERSSLGGVQYLDSDTGDRRWQYVTADDVGEPTKESRFFLPFIVDIRTDGERAYVAARRYERDGDTRSFASVVYAFEADGTVAWTYETDASPISLDASDCRLAVAYNRCPGDHQHGLVILDTDTGTEQNRWDPGTDGQRRVGDVSLVENGVAVTSHGDYRGYRLGADGKQWSVDLARPTEIDGETLYAYPNHVHATADGTVFVTGNTYSTDGRETDSLHPDEHTISGYTPEGKRAWSASAGGFAGEIGGNGNEVAVPSAQQFRTRNPGVHGLRVVDVCDGIHGNVETEGIVTAVGKEKSTIVAIEEPVVYHDEGTSHGAYRLHRLSL